MSANLTQTDSFFPPASYEINSVSTPEGTDYLYTIPAAEGAAVLAKAPVLRRNEIFQLLDPDQRDAIIAAAPFETSTHWRGIQKYPEDSIGRLMEPPVAVFSPDVTVVQAVEEIRALSRKASITCAFTVDAESRLLGILVMQDLLLARPEQLLAEITLGDPFFLSPDLTLSDAMRTVINRPYTVYPVCTGDGILIGLIRSSTLFEAQSLKLSSQAGSMVGVDKKGQLSNTWQQSLTFRQPWLQLSLLTAFIAAAIIGLFEGTLEKTILLAAFLPLMARQSGNTGAQSLALTLRAITLGGLQGGKEKIIFIKEAMIGLCSGSLIGLPAGIGMYIFARIQHNSSPFALGLIVFFAMIGSYIISGISGVIVPVTLKKLGADPAKASSIFLTTVTDSISMAIFLGLAAIFL